MLHDKNNFSTSKTMFNCCINSLTSRSIFSEFFKSNFRAKDNKYVKYQIHIFQQFSKDNSPHEIKWNMYIYLLTTSARKDHWNRVVHNLGHSLATKIIYFSSFKNFNYVYSLKISNIWRCKQIKGSRCKGIKSFDRQRLLYVASIGMQ